MICKVCRGCGTVVIPATPETPEDCVPCEDCAGTGDTMPGYPDDDWSRYYEQYLEDGYDDHESATLADRDVDAIRYAEELVRY